MPTPARSRGVRTARSSSSTPASARKTPRSFASISRSRRRSSPRISSAICSRKSPVAIGRRLVGPAAPPAAAGTEARAAGRGRGAEVKPVEIAFDEIRRRVSALPVGENYSAEAISPDGKGVLVNGAGNLYVYPLDAPIAGAGGGRGGGGAGGGSQTRQ